MSYQWARATYTNSAPQQQLITVSAVPTSGALQIEYNGGSAVMNWDNDAAGLQVLLRLISGYGSVTVSGDWTNGFLVTLVGLPINSALGTFGTNTLSNGAAITPSIAVSTANFGTVSLRIKSNNV
jgi:hypothetical protein